MSWTTPKTNWVNSDYFNREDALRINRNFHELYEMANLIYTRSSGYYVFFYNYQYGPSGSLKTVYHYYHLYTPHHDVTYVDEDYPIASVNLAQKSDRYVYALANLYYLSRFRESEYIYRSQIQVDSSPDVYVSEYGVIDPASLSDRFIYTSFIKDYSGLTSRRTSSSAYQGRVSYLVNSFYNQPFWSASELNNIESRMRTIYNRFTSYLGG